MALDIGGNGGIAGVVDVAGAPQFGVAVIYWKEATSVTSLDNTGQGSASIGDALTLIEDANIALKFRVQKALWPAPASLISAGGTVTMIFDRQGTDASKWQKKVETIRVTSFEIHQDKKDESLWEGSMSADRLSSPTYANWPGAQPATTPRTPGNQYLYAGRVKVYDPNFLVDSSVQPINVWGVSADTDAAEVTAITTIIAAYATAPISTEQQYTVTCERKSSTVLRMNINWKQRNSLNNLLYPPTKSSRSAIDADVNDVAMSVAASGQLGTQTDGIWAASEGDNFLFSMLLDPVTPNTRRATFHYVDAGILVEYDAKGEPRDLYSKMNGTNPQMYVVSNLSFGSGKRLVQFGPERNITSTVIDLYITRTLRGTIVPIQNPSTIGGVTMPFLRQINNATFEGLTALSCIYLGVHGRTRKDVANRMFKQTYKIRYDSAQDFADVPQNYFNEPQVVTTSVTSSGWTNASLLGISLVVPSSASFASFTTP